MTDTQTAVGVGWQPASNPSMAEEYEGHLLALYATGTDHVPDDQKGEGFTRQVTRATVWFIEGAEPVHHQDNAPIGWTVVQQQLARATDEAPWVVGYLKQKGRAFVLEPPKPGDYATVGQKLSGIATMYQLQNTFPGAAIEGDDGPLVPEGEEPF